MCIENLKIIVTKERSAALGKASMRVRDESMAINAEFAEIEYEPMDSLED